MRFSGKKILIYVSTQNFSMKTPRSFRGKRKQKVSVYEKERPHIIPALGMLYAFQTISLLHRAAQCTPVIGV